MTSRLLPFAVPALVAVAALCPSSVSAQPTLAAEQTSVAPGTAVNVTVTGTAGHSYAIVGSTVDSGLSFAGINFAVGSDFTVLNIGVLDANGRAVVPVTAPFKGTVLDRYICRPSLRRQPPSRPWCPPTARSCGMAIS